MNLTRRKLITASGTTVFSLSFIDIAVAQTASGNVELTADVTIPNNTSIAVEIFEDLDGNGTVNNSQEISLSDGVNTYEYDKLEGVTDSNIIYWIDVQLSTSDDSVTPEVNSLEITLPEETTDKTPTEEPTGIDSRESNAFDRILTPTNLTTELAILLSLIVGVITYANVRLRNVLIMVGWGSILVTLFLAILINLSFIWVWIAVLLTLCLILVVTSYSTTQ